MYKNKLPANIDRWRIRASLKTCSPLHVGDGEDLKISGRDCDKSTFDMKKADPSFATVFTGKDNRPLIPATSIKGALRAWAEAHGIPKTLVEAAFGKSAEAEQDRGQPNRKKDHGNSGALWFSDALLTSCPAPTDERYRCWSPIRQTALSPHVSIDPVTRSAEENLLYYLEYVPEGAVFSFDIVAQGDDLDMRNLALFLLTRAFRSPNRPARLGSQAANGWGEMNCEIDSCDILGARQWLSGDPKPWHEAFTSVDDSQRAAWLKAAGEAFTDSRNEETVEIALTLHFEGPMFVNDPTRARKAGSSAETPVSHAMLRKENGKVFLPARSVRGAFRAQARRIWQTLAWDRASQLSPGQTPAIGRGADEKSLPGFFRIFGAGGWRSPLEIADFFLCGAEHPHGQEFVAIDRFTGAAADGKKFRAEGLWRPAFAGRIRIRPSRWSEAESYAFMLIAFTLRDWLEGDGSIGFGASKGYGAFRASIEITGEGSNAELLRKLVNREEQALASVDLQNWWNALQRQTEEVAA
jgi:CRISPR/Cas system CSM-associated protein Csm3 (group 7 of RAMP superfamily)